MGTLKSEQVLRGTDSAETGEKPSLSISCTTVKARRCSTLGSGSGSFFVDELSVTEAVGVVPVPQAVSMPQKKGRVRAKKQYDNICFEILYFWNLLFMVERLFLFR